MRADRGLLIVLSGPSGAGKSTVIAALMRRRNDIRFSVSATTRAPRPGEVDGVDYFFRTHEEFARMIEEDAFLEYAEYVGNHYGTPVAPVEESLNAGFHVLLDIEVQGAGQVLTKRRDAVSVFLCPPSLAELERRLRGRGTDAEEKIRGRLAAARREYGRAKEYAYIVVNDDAELAAAKLDAIITAELCRSEKQMETILEGDRPI